MEKTKSFEEKLEELKMISKKIEDNTLSLDETMKLYEEGSRLAKELEVELDEAFRRFEKLNTSDIINNSN